MTFKQNDVARECEICHRQIERDSWMLDLFREEHARGEEHLCWVHEKCARRAIETWLKKKREKSEEKHGA
jgi:hypothetical protein